jgi:hypothetical protein
MTFEGVGARAIDYMPCRYGRSKLQFRGPRRKVQGRYIAVLGGTETYGRFVPEPYPALLEHRAGVETANLGLVNAGIDVFISEPMIQDLCAGAVVTVIQVLGAANMSNRFYAVHPRRNDRFLRASSMLKTLYPDLDFAEFNFTRHLLAALAERSDIAFAMVRQELREAWLARMKILLTRIPGPKVLLWLSDHPPRGEGDEPRPYGQDPLFVDAEMLGQLRAHVADIVVVSVGPDAIAEGRCGLIYSDLDEPVAQEMLGTIAHMRAAEALTPIVGAHSRF